ncbi:MAG: anti-sigma factor antagonist [Clostridiales bacterium]|nr:anti-sigma factor antagonist [Clostridiales bacterium]
MSVRIEHSKDVMSAYLDGDIDHHSAKAIRETIDEAIQRKKPKLLILDFRNVAFMDSSGIGLVMGRYRLLQVTRSRLEIMNVSPQTKKVMKLAGLDKLAPIKVKGCEQDESKQ